MRPALHVADDRKPCYERCLTCITGSEPRKPSLDHDLATRYAKRAAIYQASLLLIAAIMWLP
jgi:hypothetical protein